MPADERIIKNLLFNLMDNISDQIYFKDRNSRFIMVNKASAEWHKQSAPERVVGLSDFDIYQANDAERMLEDEHHILANGEPMLGVEEHEVWQDGTEAWVSTSKMPLRDECGDIIGTFGISRDITEHKQAQLRAARYAEENRNFRLRMEQELKIAAQLQKTFFPKEYPVFPAGAAPGYSAIRFHHMHFAGEEVGGDLCAVVRLSETRAAVFLCDVMGHGVRAALGTALVRAMIEDVAPQEQDPARILNRMNKQLYSMLRQDDEFFFVTACCLLIDVETGLLNVASAGHAMPIFIGADAAEWLFHDDGFRGPALAVEAQVEYEGVERQLGADDAVIMFTDGLFEVLGSGRREFGEERLLEAFRMNRRCSLKDMFPAVLKEVSGFSAIDTFEDDVCMVGFRLVRLLECHTELT